MRTNFKLSLLGAAASLWIGLAGSASAGPLYQSCIWLLPDPATGQIFYNGNCDRKDHPRGGLDRITRRPGPEPDPEDPCDCVPKSTAKAASVAGHKGGWRGKKPGGPSITATVSPLGRSFSPGPGRGGKRGR